MSTVDEEAKEDHFSKLTRDCLLDVCSRVDRETLDEMAYVSKDIHNVVNDPSLWRIKISGELFVYEQRSGHSFTMNNDDKVYSLSYHIDRITNIGLRSRLNKLYDEESHYYSNMEFYPKKKDRFGLKEEEVVEYGVSTTVPTEIFENLSKLFEKHSCEHTVFQWIKLDKCFFESIDALSDVRRAEGSKKEFTFHECQLDKSTEPEQLAEFLLSSKLTFIRIVNSRQLLHDFEKFLRAFDEQFLTKFASSIPAHLAPTFSFPVLGRWNEPVPYYWTPSSKFLPILSRFESFASDNMQLAPEAFAELIMITLNKDGPGGRVVWQFSLIHELIADPFMHIINHNEYSHEYSSTEHDEWDWFTLKKKGSAFYCTYGLWSKPNGDAMVQVLFKTEGEDEIGNEEEDEEDPDMDVFV